MVLPLPWSSPRRLVLAFPSHLAPLLNVGMAWLPFGSPGPRNEMLQNFRLRALKGLLDKKLASR